MTRWRQTGAAPPSDLSAPVPVALVQASRSLVETLALDAKDGRFVATGADDGFILLWDGFSLDPISRIAGHKSWVLSLRFDASCTLLASASKDGEVSLWQFPSLECRQVFKLGSAAQALCFLPAAAEGSPQAQDTNQESLSLD
mmetsp:Transcript_16327/g.46373  ORF Transcript_16327/g.46373 Transcript_16327/m.46373 type:complete len:143 (+) Transcript_16327:477-905(+)